MSLFGARGHHGMTAKGVIRRAAIVLAAAMGVASCLAADDPATSAAPLRDTSIERVIVRSYGAIADRYINDIADYGPLSVEALRGVSNLDSQLRIEERAGALVLYHGNRVVAQRAVPADRGDGPAWGALTAALVHAAMESSSALREAGRNRVLRAALDGTTRKLDRNSRYSDPVESRDNRFNREGDGGIGVTVEAENDQTVVRAVQDGTPAAASGVRVGDRIVSVDSRRVIGQPMREIVRELRGRVGTTVAMGVFRPSESRELVFSIRRAYVIPGTVTYERRGDIAYVRLTGFNKGTPEALKSALDKAAAEIGPGMAGIILDMRDNPGGLLDRAITTAGLLLDSGVILTTEGRHPDSRMTFRSHGNALLAHVPMVAVMNGRSASAAEILAAALQDRGRAVVVGSTSYGKGTVQTVVPLPNDGELTLTWSRMLAPSGYAWAEIGVLPTVCTAKFSDAGVLPAEMQRRAEEVRRTLADWHAVRDPTPERVTALRSLCPPLDQSPAKDIELAERVLRDRMLYARAIGYGVSAIAERPATPPPGNLNQAR
jgi:carboxyl-terminal processing protease